MSPLAEVITSLGALLTSLGALIGALVAARHSRRAASRASAVHREVTPNGGGSLRDAASRTEAASEEILAALLRVDGRLCEQARRLTELQQLHQRDISQLHGRLRRRN